MSTSASDANGDDGPLPPGRHGLPRTEVERSQRQRLIRAVIDSVAEEGYLGTNVRTITSRARVSRTAFYRFFDNREDAFLTACDELLEDLIGAVAEAYLRPGDWPARMRTGLATLLERLAADPAAARVLVIEVTGAIVHAGDRYQQLVEAFQAMDAEGVAQVGAAEQLPTSLAQMVLGGVSALLFDEIYAGRTTELEQRLPELLYTLLVPYLGHEATVVEVARAREQVAS